MKSLIALAAAVSALLLSVPSASAQSPQTYVVLENVAATPGQAQIGGNAAIPIDSAAMAQLPDVNGNIRVSCKKGTHGNSTTCSNVGAGSSGAPLAPLVTVTASASPVTTNGGKITWSSTGADACYGVSAQGPSGAPVVGGWTKEWMKVNSTTGFSLDTIFSAMSAGTTAAYDFTLRCYSTPTGIIGSTPIVAYTDKQVTVNFNKPTGTPPAGAWCDTYKASLSPAQLAHFNEYNAENRGFTAIQHDFATYTGKIPGISPTGPVIVGAAKAPYLPGKQTPSQYYAFSWSLPEQTAGQYLKFILKFDYKNGFVGGLNHDIVATLSPCPGDFRPRQNGAETYLSSYCRVAYGQDGAMIQSSSDPASPLCPVPAGARMYLNVSVRNLYDLSNHGSDTSYGPFSNCTPSLFCGKGTDVFPQ